MWAAQKKGCSSCLRLYSWVTAENLRKSTAVDSVNEDEDPLCLSNCYEGWQPRGDAKSCISALCYLWLGVKLCEGTCLHWWEGVALWSFCGASSCVASRSNQSQRFWIQTAWAFVGVPSRTITCTRSFFHFRARSTPAGCQVISPLMELPGLL